MTKKPAASHRRAPPASDRPTAPAGEESTADRLLLALDLAELAEDMLRARFERETPRPTNAEVEARIDDWYGRRPGAEHGDAPGELRPWPPQGE